MFTIARIAIGWKVCRRIKCLSCGVPVNQNARRKWNGLDFRLIELEIEKMDEVIENLNSSVKEHNGIIGKGYFFQAISYFWATVCPKDRFVTEILTFYY